VNLRARVRQVPPDHKGGYELEAQTIETEAESYDDARTALEAQVPEGWQIISLSRW